MGDCWIWGLRKNNKGYGKFSVFSRPVLAHRYIFEAVHGPIPDGLHVCHKCDNPSCVRPDHLWLGTAADNAADKMTKDRHRIGEIGKLYSENKRGVEHHMAKLTPELVADIRNIYTQQKISQRELGSVFGINQTHVGKILRKEIWKHV